MLYGSRRRTMGGETFQMPPGKKTGDGPQTAGRIPNTPKFTVLAGTRVSTLLCKSQNTCLVTPCEWRKEKYERQF